MAVRIGIDIGSSTTKIVAFEGEHMLPPMAVKADSQVASLYGAFGRYLYENNLQLLEIYHFQSDTLPSSLPAAISIVPAYPGFQNFPSPALILFRYSPHENHPHRQVHDCIRLSRTVPLKNLPFPFPFYSGDKKHRYSTFHLNRNRHGQETNLSHPV